VKTAKYGSLRQALTARDVADRKTFHKMRDQGAAVLNRERGQSLLQVATVLPFFQLIRDEFRRRPVTRQGSVEGIEPNGARPAPVVPRQVARNGLDPRAEGCLASKGFPLFPGFFKGSGREVFGAMLVPYDVLVNRRVAPNLFEQGLRG